MDTLLYKKTRFDNIASSYADFGTENTPIRRYAEKYTVLKCMGDITGANALDAACSDGYFSRLLLEAGASSVVGLDISATMIDVARQKTHSPDIKYNVGNVLSINQKGEYDFLMSSFAQCYARNLNELHKICTEFFNSLKSGGRILALNDNPDFLSERHIDYRKYGKSKTRSMNANNGDIIEVCWHCVDDENNLRNIPFSCHYYKRETLIEAFENAGFVNVRIHNTEVSPEGMAAFGEEYWDLLLNHSLFCVITAEKP